MNTSGVAPPVKTEWVLPLPTEGELTPVTHVRGTLLATSREQLRAAGHFAEYERALAPHARAPLDAAHATMWFPLELAHDHFAAVDRLGITEREVMEITEEVSRKLSGAFMQAASVTLRNTGLTPWDIVPFYGKVWRRLFVGGALGIVKAGPKDARIVIAGQPLMKHRYYRIGVSRHLVIGIQFLVEKSAYVRELAVDPAAGKGEFLLQWV